MFKIDKNLLNPPDLYSIGVYLFGFIIYSKANSFGSSEPTHNWMIRRIKRACKRIAPIVAIA